MAQRLSCRRQKARGMWSGLFQWCISKSLRSKCPSAVGKVKSMLHSQTAWRTEFCTGEATWNTWICWAKTGEMLLTLQPVEMCNLQPKGLQIHPVTTPNGIYIHLPKLICRNGESRWNKEDDERGQNQINWKISADFLVKYALINISMWKFSCLGSPVDVQASAGFSATVTSSLYDLPLPDHVIVMSL